MRKFLVERDTRSLKTDCFVVEADDLAAAIEYVKNFNGANDLRPHFSTNAIAQGAPVYGDSRKIDSYNRAYDHHSPYVVTKKKDEYEIGEFAAALAEVDAVLEKTNVALALAKVRELRSKSDEKALKLAALALQYNAIPPVPGPLSPAAEVSLVKMPKIGYKVTRNSSSVFIRIHGMLDYPFHGWVLPDPDCGPISVFAAREEAVSWLESMGGQDRVYRHPTGLRVRECLYFPSTELDKMWAGERHIERAGFPDGTVLARAVFCLE